MRELARRLSLTTDHYTNLWRIEHDYVRPTARTIARFADVCGVTAEERDAWVRMCFVRQPPTPQGTPWSEAQRSAHFATVSLRARGRCRLSDYRLRLGLTGAELARRADIEPYRVSALETGNASPARDEFYTNSSPWTDTAQVIADTLGVTCAWLWPEHAPATPRLMREETPTPEALYADAEMRERVRAAVASLPPRERAVIVRRFGLIDGEEATLEETAPHVGGVSRERVRQLEAQALRQLRAILRNALDDAA